MKLSIGVGGYARSDVASAVEYVQAAERMGIDAVWSAEAWGFDAVTSLAFLAAHTERIKLGTGIMQISARVPAMTAMTAMSVNTLSNGRFVLGLGASGPQVVEGLHGADYRMPLTRLRETVEICRLAFSGQKLRYDGRVHVLPRPGGEGKPIRLDAPSANIPIYLATLSPRSLEYTGAAADGWLGTSFSPEHADAHLAHIERGAKQAGRTLEDLDLNAAVSVAIGDDVPALVDSRKPGVAFNMGAMGSANTNFYNAAFQRAGYADDAKAIQRLWLDGKREEAAHRVPDAMVTEFQAIGTREMVHERFQKYKDVGIDSLSLRLDAVRGSRARLALLENVVDLVDQLA
ncbi:MAG: LLM class flavin-dependent oxidoreductase [Myxococcales bacterium]|nr:LLM class flavin-dependent oxidoreductase [Myxococcales bacterium]